jgi:hypothetical protein
MVPAIYLERKMLRTSLARSVGRDAVTDFPK